MTIYYVRDQIKDICKEYFELIVSKNGSIYCLINNTSPKILIKLKVYKKGKKFQVERELDYSEINLE